MHKECKEKYPSDLQLNDNIVVSVFFNLNGKKISWKPNRCIVARGIEYF